MQAAIQLALTLLEQVVPQLLGANAPLIEKIVEGLVAIVPILIKDYNSSVPFIKNIIYMLKNNNQITADQLKTLDDLEIQIDASFEEEAARALAEDK